MRDAATSAPASMTSSLKIWRSSPLRMASTFAPMSSTPYLSRIPCSCRAIAALSAVWPPSVGRIASGFSFAMIVSMTAGVIGSMYVASAKSGSVMIVAGFELTRMTRTPSSRSTRQACVPE